MARNKLPTDDRKAVGVGTARSLVGAQHTAGVKVLFEKIVHGDHSLHQFFNANFHLPAGNILVVQAAMACGYDNEGDVAWIRTDLDGAEKVRGCAGGRGGQYADAITTSFVMLGDDHSHSLHIELAWYSGVIFKETSVIGYLIPFTPPAP